MLLQNNWARACLPVLAVAFMMSFGAPSPASAQIYLDSLGEPETEDGPSETLEPRLRPDAKQDDESEPPLSAQERKRDRLGLELDDMPLPEPLDRAKLLAEFYDRLGVAASPKAAEPIIAAIEELWRISGSDTVDLLVSRAEKFIQEADLDLALKILDAAADIAPDDAEIWHQRAKVHALKQNHERALVDLRRTLNIDPKHYGAMDDLGAVLQGMGATKEALKSYRQALEVNPFLDSARRSVEALSREVEGQDI
ncbi:MAG: hypothetical protein ACOYB4_11385 [Methyloceanibacter sp.]